MVAEYNKWYPCKKGTMPEDFENVSHIGYKDMPYLSQPLLAAIDDVRDGKRTYQTTRRYKRRKDWAWHDYYCAEVVAWMLPEPYQSRAYGC